MSQYIDVDAIVAEVESALKYFDIRASQKNIDLVLERVGDNIQDGMYEVTQDAEERDSFEESCGDLESTNEGLETELEKIELDLEWDKMQASFDLYAHGKQI